MIITIITPSFPYPKRGEIRGSRRVTENLAIYLKKLGNHIKIITTFDTGDNKYDNFKGMPILRVLDSRFLLGKYGHIFYLDFVTFGLNLFRKKNFKFYENSDVIILGAGILFSRFFLKKKIPVISLFHHYSEPKSIKGYLALPGIHYMRKKQFKRLIEFIREKAGNATLINIYDNELKKGNVSLIPKYQTRSSGNVKFGKGGIEQ